MFKNWFKSKKFSITPEMLRRALRGENFIFNGNLPKDILSTFNSLSNKDNSVEQDHKNTVKRLQKHGRAILEDLTPITANLLHMAVGVSGEAGELVDAIKKHTIYNKPIDRENVIEELGDIEFYMEGIRNALGISRKDTLSHNINKLLSGKNARYSKGEYSNEQAQERRDKSN